MDDEKTLHDLVRHEILQGHTREAIFIRAYSMFGQHQCKIALILVKKWYWKHYKLELQQIPGEFRSIVEAIRQEFQSASHGLKGVKCVRELRQKCNLKLINERYALEQDHTVSNFYIYDLWHGQRRKLKMANSVPPIETNCTHELQVIDPEYFLLFYHVCVNYSLETVFYLFHLNLADLKCTFLDKQERKGRYERCTIDVKNHHKFVWFVTTVGEPFFQRCCLLNEKLHFDEKLLVFNLDEQVQTNHSVRDTIWTYKLEDDKLHGINTSWPNLAVGNTFRFVFTELILEPDRVESFKIYDIEMSHEFAGIDSVFYFDKFLWYKDACYMLHVNQSDKTELYKFDLDSRTGSVAKIIGGFVPVESFHIDRNIVTICGLNSESDRHTWKRIVLSENEPDKSLHIALKAIRQHAMFLDQQEHRKFVQRIPVKLRPFQ